MSLRLLYLIFRQVLGLVLLLGRTSAPGRGTDRCRSGQPGGWDGGGAASLEIVDVDIVGRPATFATASEAAWRAAVASAVGERDVPEATRFAVEVEFRLPTARMRNEVWDLDNLLKPTLDALGGVIGWRSWQGRPQADDERIDRIVASKRPTCAAEMPGARLRVVPLAERI